jgi:hyperosmotically inducible periplasmic protein
MNGNHARKIVAGAVIMLACVNGWSQTGDASHAVGSNRAAPDSAPPTAAKSNRALRKRIYAAFAMHKEIDAGSISVTVRDGMVTLNGTVPDPAQVDKVAQVTKSVQGVVSVTNKLTVQRPLSE